MNVDVIKKKHRIFMDVRSFFNEQNFIEIHTPLLVPNPGLEPHLIPFETSFEPGLGGGTKQHLYLPTSPEYHLKKALAEGFDSIFEITKSFRNSERSNKHEPEFFMLEWYRSPGSYKDIAKDCEKLFTRLGQNFGAPEAPWNKSKHLTVCEAFQRYAEVDLLGALKKTKPTLTQQARNKNILSVLESDDFDTTFDKIMIERIEPRLGFEGPLFLWDYPAPMCALARIKATEPHLAERFEIYWRGVELANAFGELTDTAEQRRRCLEDQEKRRQLYEKEPPPLDEDFLHALGRLTKPVGGIAVGLERLIQCLLDLPRVQDAIAFPHYPSDI